MYQQYIPKWHLLERHYQKIFLTGLPIPPLTKKEIKPYKDSEDHWEYEKNGEGFPFWGWIRRHTETEALVSPKQRN